MTLPRELRADFWQAFRRPEVRKFLVRMCAGYQGTLPRLEKQYPQITCPTLALWGENDRHFPPVHAERLQALIPGCDLQIVPDGEHWMAWYRADTVAEQIRSWAASRFAEKVEGKSNRDGPGRRCIPTHGLNLLEGER